MCIDPDEGDMQRRKRLNFLNILYYYVQRCIASSNNSNLDIIIGFLKLFQ